MWHHLVTGQLAKEIGTIIALVTVNKDSSFAGYVRTSTMRKLIIQLDTEKRIG